MALLNGGKGIKDTTVSNYERARSEFLPIYTKNIGMSGRPARRPAVVTLLRGLYLWNRIAPVFGDKVTLSGPPVP